MSASKALCTASILLILSAPSVCDFCGVENLPEFWSTRQQNDGLPNRVAGLIPSYIFSCAGYVKQWRAHVEAWESSNDLYQVTFSVWRRTESQDDNCTYTKVGENFHHGLAPEIGESGGGIVTLNVSSEQRVLVRPGDFVGFQLHHYVMGSPSGEGAKSHGASVVMDFNRTNITVWYRSSPFQQACISDKDLVEKDFIPLSPLSPDQLLPLSAAPVIDVAVEMLFVPLNPLPTTLSSIPLNPLPTTSSSIPLNTLPTTSSSIPLNPLPTTLSSIPTSAVLSSTPPPITPTVTTSTSSNTAAVPIIIIIITVIIIILLVCVLALLSLLLCVVAVKRKQKQQKGQTPYTCNSGMMQNYLYLSSKTMPGHYKRNDTPSNGHVYDILSPTAPEPLPVLNPALLSNSDSISTTSSSPNDYELMYSAVLPVTATWKNQPGLGSTQCPLYSSILEDAYESKIHNNTEDPAYDIIPAHENNEQSVVYDVVNNELPLDGKK